MSKYGFNPKELRKTIITRIDKDGFHERTVEYAGESSDSDTSMIAGFARATMGGVLGVAYYPEDTAYVTVMAPTLNDETTDDEFPWEFNVGDEFTTELPTTTDRVDEKPSPSNKIAIIVMPIEMDYGVPYHVYALDSNYVVLDRCSIVINSSASDN